MKIKLDENIPNDAATIFAGAGHQVSTVVDQGLGGKADPEAAAACKAESKVRIMLDADFATLGLYPPENYSGIIVLRLRIRQSRTCSQSLLGFWIRSDGNRHQAIYGLWTNIASGFVLVVNSSIMRPANYALQRMRKSRAAERRR
jgi:predicted nuclease of predicted toxin-antitoxin system